MRLPNGYGSVIKLAGNRRKPYQVRITSGWHFNEETGKQIQEYTTLGYTTSKKEGLQILADFHDNPFDLSTGKITFQNVYDKWSKSKFSTISKSNLQGYKAAYKLCDSLNDMVFKDIKLADMQKVVDKCDKNYPTLRKLKVLFNQLYDHAIKNDVCNKDYSDYVDILKYKNKNPNKFKRDKFTTDDIEKMWSLKNDKYYQIVLMLIYSGVRISEFLDLKKTNINLEKQYFDIQASKTENGLRRVPIADKTLPFFKNWYESSECQYLLHNEGKHFQYRNYYDSYFIPLMTNLGFTQTPHCCRHTCVSMLATAKVEQTLIKLIVGHSGAMTLTEKVYTHIDVEELVHAINQI